MLIGVIIFALVTTTWLGWEISRAPLTDDEGNYLDKNGNIIEEEDK